MTISPSNRLVHTNLWASVKASALKRLGKPLLISYLVLTLVALMGVLGTLGWLWIGQL